MLMVEKEYMDKRSGRVWNAATMGEEYESSDEDNPNTMSQTAVVSKKKNSESFTQFMRRYCIKFFDGMIYKNNYIYVFIYIYLF
jgi:hypothetical protein